MARKVHQLKNTEVSDFFLLALASHEPDYRASWLLNQGTGLNLVRTGNLKIWDQKTAAELEFSQYFFDDSGQLIQYFLLSNHTENAFLVPELKNVDFFLRISGEVKTTDVRILLEKIKNIDGILTAFEISLPGFKSIHCFIF